MKKGFLISFEGGEGCGKSTQIKKFSEYLKQRKIDFILVREPGGTEVGEKIRDILLHDKSDLSAETEFLLFSASRNKLVADVVKPALRDGKVVVMDRYFDSSYAYQGYAGKLNLDDVKSITNFAIGKDAIPDLTILLDIGYEEGMFRKQRDEKLQNLDRIEKKAKEYHDNVRKGYLDLASKDKKRFYVIDALQTPEEISKKIVDEFEKKYKNKQKNA